jgi:hypothetical protein
MAEHPEDYEVGYKKPPKASQFKPGESGNPKGKQKGKKGLKADLAAALDAKQTIKVNDKPFTGRRQELLLTTLAIRAAAGDLKAAQTLLPLIVQVLGIEDRGIARGKLSKHDQAILDASFADLDELETEPEVEAEPETGGAGDLLPPTGNDVAAPDEDKGRDDEEEGGDGTL